MNSTDTSLWKRTLQSLGRIDYRLFGTLILMSLLPTIYLTVRINFLGNLPGDWGYNIASQLTWLNVSYEVVHEALMLPMFYLIGKFLHNQKKFRQGNLKCRYSDWHSLCCPIITHYNLCQTMIVFMAQKTELVDATVSYIRLEAISIVLTAFVRFFTIVLVLRGRELYLFIVLGVQLVLSILLDSLFISQLTFSLNLGVNGIAYANIIVNTSLVAILVFQITREGVGLFPKGFTLDFRWLGEWFRIGGLSGLESFVRNAAFILMVIRLINVVQEQGTFWVTNNFIWGWLLLPVLALGELIRRDVAEEEASIKLKSPGYFAITAIIIILWLITMPAWRWFIGDIMNIAEPETVLNLVVISLIFYVTFAFNNVVDSIFYGRGRTDLMLYQSLIVNTVFYGGAFVLYRTGVYVPTLTAIAVMFGVGIAFDSLITLIMYRRFVRRLPVVS
jgi:Na+-driven multidrug efflux pump